MRAIAWFFILINLGLLVYFNVDILLPQTPQIKWAELEPEKIQLLSEQQLNALPKRAATVAEPVAPTTPAETEIEETVQTSACMEWGPFTEPTLTKVQAQIAQHAIPAALKEEPHPQSKQRFWVYIPAFNTAKEARTYATELKNLGVEDFFIVQEPKWKNAISLGLFEDELLAQNLLDKLKTKGVKNAQKTNWNTKTITHLIFTKLDPAQVEKLNTIARAYPQIKLSETGC